MLIHIRQKLPYNDKPGQTSVADGEHKMAEGNMESHKTLKHKQDVGVKKTNEILRKSGV